MFTVCGIVEECFRSHFSNNPQNDMLRVTLAVKSFVTSLTCAVHVFRWSEFSLFCLFFKLNTIQFFLFFNFFLRKRSKAYKSIQKCHF